MQSKSAEEEKTPLDQDDDSLVHHGGGEQDVLLDRVPQSNRLGVEVHHYYFKILFSHD